MKRPRPLSARRARRLMNLYPPFLLQSIRVVELTDDFRYVRVAVRPSWLTRNLQGSRFGGTIFAAADPCYALMYWQHFSHRGVAVQAWLRSARVRYRRPAVGPLLLEFRLEPSDFEQAAESLATEGRFARTHRVEVVDRHQRVCAEIETEVYLRPVENPRGPGDGVS